MKTVLIKLNDSERQLLFDFCFQIDAAMKDEKDLPPKFALAQTAFGKITTETPVNSEEVMGLLDTIGGYVSASVALSDKSDSIKERNSIMTDARGVMVLAETIERQARFANFEGLKPVKND